MRKDVKFGLTIGAILVVTLVIYVIVLSRGPSAQRIGVVPPSQSDQTTAESTDSTTDSNVAAHSTDEVKPDVPSEQDSNNPVSNTTPPTQISAPSTQPTAAAQPNTDWEGALDHGLPVTLAAPERTMTPTIDPGSSSVARGGISRLPNTPLIDPLPSTQPSQPLLADLPTLEAPAMTTPAPAALTPVQNPDPSFVNTANIAPNSPRTHRVESGESPYSISETVYGSGKYYKKILAANPGINPRSLKIGQVLIIPELTATDKPVSTSAADTAASQAINPNTAYKVAAGDSLETISRKLYGTPRMMDKLYEMNKTLIGPDENVLKIGWILQLPQAPAADGGQR